MAGEFTDEEMAQLSDEERAALKDDDDEDVTDELEGDDNPDEDALNADDDSDDDTDDEDVKDEKEAEEVKATDKEEKKTDLSAFEENDDEEDTPQFLPNMRVDAIEGYDEKMADLQKQRDELLAKVDQGEIELGDYVKQDRVLADQEVDLKMSKTMADNQLKQNAHQQAQKWEWEQEQFFAQDANQIYAEDTMLGAAFNAKVMELAKVEAEKGSNKSGTWFLKEADKAIRARFNLGGDTNQNANKEVKSRKPDLKGIPKTLANLPQVENDNGSAGEFDYLDKLSGDAQERELARLAKTNPEKLEEYLRA